MRHVSWQHRCNGVGGGGVMEKGGCYHWGEEGGPELVASARFQCLQNTSNQVEYGLKSAQLQNCSPGQTTAAPDLLPPILTQWDVTGSIWS